MQKTSREGVDIDICPTCSGVWLDRGEFDNLLVQELEASEVQLRAQRRLQEEVWSFKRDPNPSRRTHPCDTEKQRHRYEGDDDHPRRKRGGGFDLFDILD